MPVVPFRWGVATSAFQIEGARHADGKSDSIWDRFGDDGHMPVPGDTACDHYNRLNEDLDLLAALGVGAYRFSIAWTRVIPDGAGDINPAGLGFYDRLVDGLLERGIEPWPTLYHWDLPQVLQDGGGWSERSTTDHFAHYADVLAKHLGDRVTNWITHNEPWVATYLGHLYGVFAPGMSDWSTALTTAHHILVSHGKATKAIRDAWPGARVGIALDCRPARPASPTPEDAAASRYFDGFRNRWFFDPVFGMGYPSDMVEAFREKGRIEGDVPAFVQIGDMDLISTPNDFLGLNYYTTLPVPVGSEERDDPEEEPGTDPPDGFTEMGWAIDPDGLRDYLVHLSDRYDPPSLVVTENGASYSTGPDVTGSIPDDRRIDYLDAHVDAVIEASRRGAPVDGYFVWSLMDNLEWVQGFDQRFGLVWVDHATQRRIPKKSFEWFRRVVEPESPQSRALSDVRAS